ncbi:MAG: AAA family ATPase [Proteobacteria bacterium]|nr:AAA family ATPase [Pseudomonadota bacterium]
MMFHRDIKLPISKSFFLFGARGVGKSTLLRLRLDKDRTHTINLLLAQEEDRFVRNPDLLIDVVEALPQSIQHIVIDEVQKVPKLLDLVHYLLEERASTRQFIMTGSSARKLRHGQANLLAGRAFTRQLSPLTVGELGQRFDLESYLAWGGLPAIWGITSDTDRSEFLRSYALTFLKEEIQAEQVVRNLNPFRRFLEVAAQSSGKLLNYAKIARDVGADAKTVKSYYGILEDTLLGFMLEPFHTSRRKRLTQAPKFYFFDTGVTRALAGHLAIPPTPSTAYYGELFEHMVILELRRRAEYGATDYRFTFLRTEDQAEVDLVIERPGKALALVEIKSGKSLEHGDLTPLRHLQRFANDFPDAELFCLSASAVPMTVGRIKCLPWQQGIEMI